MKLNFQQKFNLIMLTVFMAGAVAVCCFSGRNGARHPETFVNPIGSTDSTFAVCVPEPC